MQNLNNLGMQMGRQGFAGTGAQVGLLSQGALAQMQGANAPTASQNMFSGALGGMLGMAKVV